MGWWRNCKPGEQLGWKHFFKKVAQERPKCRQIIAVVSEGSGRKQATGKSSPRSRNHKDQPSISNSDLLNKHSGWEFYPCVYVREDNVYLLILLSSKVFRYKIISCCQMRRGAKRNVCLSLRLCCGTKPSKYFFPIQISRWLPCKSLMSNFCLWQQGAPHATWHISLLYFIPFCMTCPSPSPPLNPSRRCLALILPLFLCFLFFLHY